MNLSKKNSQNIIIGTGAFAVIACLIVIFSFHEFVKEIGRGESAIAAMNTMFNYEVIDADNKGRIAVGDIDGDSKNDIIVHAWGDNRGVTANGTLVWYKYPAWTKNNIVTGRNFFGDEINAVDIDFDGDVDVIAPVGNDNLADVYLYENLDGRGTSWKETKIGTAATASEVKDVHTHDIDNDGKLDIAVRTKKHAVIFYQNTKTSWEKRSTGVVEREGSIMGDVDNDGDFDFILNGYWLRNPGTRSDNWARFDIDSLWYAHSSVTACPSTICSGSNNETWRNYSVRAQFVDLDGDGKKEIIYSHSEHNGFNVTYYKTTNPTGGISAWTKKQLGIVDFSHSLQAADFDLDGDIDILAAATKWRIKGKAIIFNNNGSGNFTMETLSEDYMYTAVIGDIDNDGDQDILSAKSWEDVPVGLWRNSAANTNLTAWTYKAVDTQRDKYSVSWYNYFGIYSKDINKDGYSDIVSGKYFYKNPGGDALGIWQRTILPVDSDAALIIDVDKNGNEDIIAFALPDIYWFTSENNGTSWSVKRKISLTTLNIDTDHKNPQGSRLADINKDGKIDIIFEAGRESAGTAGLYVLEIPNNPITDNWPLTRITQSGGDGFGIGDIDKDGDLDIAIGQNNIKWYENPGSLRIWAGYNVGATDSQSGRSIMTTKPNDVVNADRFAIADIDGDGRNDVIISEETWPHQDNFPTYCYWFKAPSDPKTGIWQKNYVAKDYHGLQSMETLDADNDGDIDVVLGEHKMAKRVFIFNNDGQGYFTPQKVGEGKESHGLIVDDFNKDGKPDIAHIGWDDFKNLHLWVSHNVTGPVDSGCTGGTVENGNPVWNDVLAGSIYKEIAYVPAGDGWRVTDPNSPLACTAANTNEPCDFPNQTFTINNVDKANAGSAELWLDRWGGHTGTVGHKVKFNNNAWRELPISLNGIAAGQKSQCYMYEDLTKVEIPLSDLLSGQNSFTFTSSNQDSSCAGAFNWGQWGWYVSKLRIFYNNSKPHPTGTITSPSSNATIGDNPVISVSTQPGAGASIERVEFYAQYYGYDENGDGNFYDVHRMYHGSTNNRTHSVIGHIGTRTAAPYSLTWDTSWVPDQETGGIAIFAKIKDTSGTWYVTEVINNITLSRENSSVKLYQPKDVPVNFWVRNNQSKSSKANIPSDHDLSKASAAKLFIRTWNAGNNEQRYTPMTVNGTAFNGLTGSDHNFDYLALDIPKTLLKNGDNVFTFSSATQHHGCEIHWPGPAIMVRYNYKIGCAASGQTCTNDMAYDQCTNNGGMYCNPSGLIVEDCVTCPYCFGGWVCNTATKKCEATSAQTCSGNIPYGQCVNSTSVKYCDTSGTLIEDCVACPNCGVNLVCNVTTKKCEPLPTETCTEAKFQCCSKCAPGTAKTTYNQSCPGQFCCSSCEEKPGQEPLLKVGTYKIRVTAKDSKDNPPAVDTITINVLPPDSVIATIETPDDNANFTQGETINFTSTVTSGAAPLTYSWTSDKQGEFSTGIWPGVNEVNTSNWAIGPHTITFKATDRDNNSNTNSINITINKKTDPEPPPNNVIPPANTGQARGRVKIVNNTLVADNGWLLRGENPRLGPAQQSDDPNYWANLRDNFHLNTVRILAYREPQSWGCYRYKLTDEATKQTCIDKFSCHLWATDNTYCECCSCGNDCQCDAWWDYGTTDCGMNNFNLTTSASDFDTNKDGELIGTERADWLNFMNIKYVPLLDRWVNNAAKYGFYAIIDYHPVGGYNRLDVKEWWQIVAPRYKDKTHVLYEYINEPVKWVPNNYQQYDIDFQADGYKMLRALAPDTHLIFWSFANGREGMRLKADGTNQINYSNASVGFHIYGLQIDAVRECRSAYPVMQTEIGGESPTQYNDRIKSMEADGISWITLDGTEKATPINVTWEKDPWFN
ncbi:MAG: FG-GAP-like repeat-containing protein [Patescibacteria group bacterium]